MGLKFAIACESAPIHIECGLVNRPHVFGNTGYTGFFSCVCVYVRAHAYDSIGSNTFILLTAQKLQKHARIHTFAHTRKT